MFACVIVRLLVLVFVYLCRGVFIFFVCLSSNRVSKAPRGCVDPMY